MEIQFIGQGLNALNESCVASSLIGLLNDSRYNSFQCLVAFASAAGVGGLSEHINNSKSHISDFRIIIGVDQFGTSREALEKLLELDVNCSVFYTTSPIIFHPKIYLFEGEDDIAVIIGSNNLTLKGLVQNIEGAILIKHSKVEEIDFLEQVTEHYSPIFDGTDDCVYPLTEVLIQELVSQGIVKTEAEVRRIYNVKDPVAASVASAQDSNQRTRFTSRRTQTIPSHFNSSNSRIPEVVVTNTRSNSSNYNGEDWTIHPDSSVLIAQVGRGERWKQVNFPISMFVNFFGATAGDNSYHIRIRHLENNGVLNEIETRQAVTVKSNNYRFEIGTASGLGYPTTPDKPIVVFIKVGIRDFLYKLLMPHDEYYTDVNLYLNAAYNGPNRNLKRITKPLPDIQQNCPPLYELIQNYIQ